MDPKLYVYFIADMLGTNHKILPPQREGGVCLEMGCVDSKLQKSPNPKNFAVLSRWCFQKIHYL